MPRSIFGALLATECLSSPFLKVQNISATFTNKLPGHRRLGWMSAGNRREGTSKGKSKGTEGLCHCFLGNVNRVVVNNVAVFPPHSQDLPKSVLLLSSQVRLIPQNGDNLIETLTINCTHVWHSLRAKCSEIPFLHLPPQHNSIERPLGERWPRPLTVGGGARNWSLQRTVPQTPQIPEVVIHTVVLPGVSIKREASNHN